MSYVIKAVLHNPSHPEYGQITIPFPIPLDEYDQTIEMLQAIELGFSVNRDSIVDEVESPYKPLALLKNTMVNVDQLDYLAKRLAGFCAEETSQFQALAHHLNLCDIKDLINLTFCCQKATVITDFSDLEKIGHSHYIHLCGGSDVTEDLEYLDGEETAYLKQSILKRLNRSVKGPRQLLTRFMLTSKNPRRRFTISRLVIEIPFLARFKH